MSAAEGGDPLLSAAIIQSIGLRAWTSSRGPAWSRAGHGGTFWRNSGFFHRNAKPERRHCGRHST
jgi:hypothetical protein